MKATILANGTFPTKTELINDLYNAEFLIVCDGAITHLDHLQIYPNYIIGDLDSISENLKLKYQDKLIHQKDQETNDLTKAFFYAHNLGFREFDILGATGKREDHTIANIALLTHFIQYAKNISLKSDFGIFSAHYPPCQISSQKGQQISIFSFNQNAKLTSKNLKYPLNQLPLDSLQKGTLNEALSSTFSLSSTDPTPILIYQAYELKTQNVLKTSKHYE